MAHLIRKICAKFGGGNDFKHVCEFLGDDGLPNRAANGYDDLMSAVNIHRDGQTAVLKSPPSETFDFIGRCVASACESVNHRVIPFSSA